MSNNRTTLTTSISDLASTARALGINLKHPAEVADLLSASVAARKLNPERSDLIGELVATKPADWDKTIDKALTADYRARRITEIKEALGHRIDKEIPVAIRRNRDHYLALFSKALDTDALANSARDLPTLDPAEAIRLGVGTELGNLLDAEQKVTALQRLIAGFQLRGRRDTIAAAIIVKPTEGLRERVVVDSQPDDMPTLAIRYRAAPASRTITPDHDLARVTALRQIHTDLNSADPNTRAGALVAAANNPDATITVPTTTAELLSTAETWQNVLTAETVTPVNA